MKYSDTFVSWLQELGYTHCFYVAGGNIMHLLESASHVFECIPVVHEVTAGIAAEYFNESQTASGKKAFAMVTAGPGLTNIITAMAGAFLESRDLLVVGGQVKSTDLKEPGIRQSGIQEIDGMSLTHSLTVAQLQIREPLSFSEIASTVIAGNSGKKGPVFIEFCLDAQGALTPEHLHHMATLDRTWQSMTRDSLPASAISKIKSAKRPVLLLGGGVTRETAKSLSRELRNLPVPVMTTWNATDRIGSDAPSYAGRPNTWGQRSANVILQQADLVIAAGTRMGLQQTGFNWQEFLPAGKLIQIEIDKGELEKKVPNPDEGILADVNSLLPEIIELLEDSGASTELQDWMSFVKTVRTALPLSEAENKTRSGFVNPYDFFMSLSEVTRRGDAVIPSSSGAAETVAMQALNQKEGSIVITTKGLASMGYGLGGAIGASIGGAVRVFHIEGDGGFAQNMQDLGTVSAQNLNIKMFILCNDGYASIRMTQRSYFDGHYVGCDSNTGLGLPNWAKLASAFDIPCTPLDPGGVFSHEIMAKLDSHGPEIFLVPVDPEQTYYPKITSKLDARGNLRSNPLHLMTPPLAAEIEEVVFKFLT